jgi:hypothetical protein
MARRTEPDVIPGLTVEQAAADTSTLVALLVGGIGALILVPSLFVLFRLLLTGRLDPGARVSAPPPGRPRAGAGSRARPLAVPLTLGMGAAVLLVFATVSWLQLVAALAILGALALALPRLVTQKQSGE